MKLTVQECLDRTRPVDSEPVIGFDAYVYILRCQDGSLYTGWTTNWQQRLQAHARGQGSKYTRSRLPAEMVFLRGALNRSIAQSVENFIKKLTKSQKECLIAAPREP